MTKMTEYWCVSHSPCVCTKTRGSVQKQLLFLLKTKLGIKVIKVETMETEAWPLLGHIQ